MRHTSSLIWETSSTICIIQSLMRRSYGSSIGKTASLPYTSRNSVTPMEHSGHAYITMSIILLITYISQTLITDILATNNPILIKLLLLDLSYLDKSNGSIFIKFESLDAKIFPILHFYYELSHWLISFSEGNVCSAGL